MEKIKELKIGDVKSYGRPYYHGLTVDGFLKSGERFYIRFGGYNNQQLIKLLNSKRSKSEQYDTNGEYMSIDTSVYTDGGECWRFPRDAKTRAKWLKLLGWRDMGGRYAIEQLKEYTADNVKKFLRDIGAIVERVEVLPHK